MDRYRLLKVCLFRGLGAGREVMANTYAYMLFLSSYPASAIPYLYISLAFSAFIFMQLTEPFLKRDLSKFMRISHISFMIVLIFFAFFITAPPHWVPFIFAIFILMASSIASTTNWIVVLAVFNLREFKSVGKWTSAASTFGTILGGLLVPLLLMFFSPIILLYATIAFFGATLWIEFYLNVPKERAEKEASFQDATPNYKNPFFINTFLTSVLLLVLIIFTDFSLKSELKHYYSNQRELGNFLALLASITNLVTVFAQMLILPGVLRRFGVIGLIMISPLVFIALAALMLVYPSLWSATLLAGVALVMRSTFFTLGNQMLFNVYPTAIRNVAKYQVQSWGRLGTAFGCLLLTILAYVGSLRIMSVAIILASALMIYITLELKKNYFSELKKSINLHRFDTDYLGSERIDQELTLKAALEALSSEKEEDLLFGLTLLNRVKLKKIPIEIQRILFSEYESVRKKAILLFENSEDESVLQALMKLLEREKNSEIIWLIVSIVSCSRPTTLLPFAQDKIFSNDPAIRAAAICVFFKTGDSSKVSQAREEFMSLLRHHEAFCRYWAGSLLKVISIPDGSKFIMDLINDPDVTVANNGIYAANFYANDEIIQLIIRNLGNKNLSHSAVSVLLMIGPKIIPALLSHVRRLRNPREIKLATILLSKFPSIEAEQSLLELLNLKNNAILEMCAESLAYRAMLLGLSDRARLIVYSYVLSEVETIRELSKAYSFYQDVDLKNEIYSRILSARKRYLYFLASYINKKIILQILPALLYADHKSGVFSNAIELLELLVEDVTLKYSIAKAFEDKISAPLNESDFSVTQDSWLKSVLEFKRGSHIEKTRENIIKKVLALRKISLFSSLSPELLESISELIQEKTIESNEVIFEEGGSGNGMYTIISGEVQVVKNNVIINSLGAGDFFGELALLDGAPRFASAIAEKEARLFYIAKNDFDRLTDENPEIFKKMAKVIIRYLR